MSYFDIAIVFALSQILYLIYVITDVRNKLNQSDVPLIVLLIMFILINSICWPISIVLMFVVIYIRYKRK